MSHQEPEGTKLNRRWRITKVEHPAPIYTFVCDDGAELRTSDPSLAISVGCLITAHLPPDRCRCMAGAQSKPGKSFGSHCPNRGTRIDDFGYIWCETHYPHDGEVPAQEEP